MVNIAFDTWSLTSQFRNTGIFNYSLSLLSEFRELVRQDRSAKLHAFTSVSRVNDAVTVPAGPGFDHVPVAALDHSRRWRLWGMMSAARAVGADVVFSPTAQACPTGSIPLVTTVHDATPIRVPGQTSLKITALLRSYLWIAMKFSRHIITVSERTKSDLLDIYDVPPEKVSVVYNGFDRNCFNRSEPDRVRQEELKAKHGIIRPYLFHHGTVQPRKNLERLIRSHRLLLDRHPDLELDLVLVGSLGWLYEPILACAKEFASSRGRAIFTGSLPDLDLALILKGAEVCVIPSLYEGFCLPMVEAMACGVPTITSNSSCFPEVSGNVLRYFDPLSEEDIVASIDKVLDDGSERERLVANGIERAGYFSWQRAARETLQVLLNNATNQSKPRATNAAAARSGC